MKLSQLDQLVQDVYDGNENPLKAYAIFNDIEKHLKKVKQELYEAALAEAEKYGEKQFEAEGFKFEIRQGRRLWNFKDCEVWNNSKEQLKEVETTLKSQWEAAQRGLTMLNEETGEVPELPKVTYTNPSIIVKQ